MSGAMGEFNAPERWTIQGSYREHGSLPVAGRLLEACERVEVVEAAAYDLVVAERDEARAERDRWKGTAAAWSLFSDRYREALEELADAVGTLPTLEASYRHLAVVQGPHSRARAVLAEGKQPAGEPVYDAELRDIAVRVVDQHHGCTVEQSASPEAHQGEYEMVERGMREALAARRPAAGEQSTTEPDDESVGAELSRMEADLLDIRDALADGDDDDLPINAESIIERIGELRARSSAPSTTETATGDVTRHRLLLGIGAALNSDPGSRLLHRRQRVALDAAYAAVPPPADRDQGSVFAAINAYLRSMVEQEAAAPATPEGPDA